MACHFNDNVYTKVFTPREYQVELLDTLKERNTIVCLGSKSNKLFLSVKLVQELAAQVRRPLSEGGKRSVYILDRKNVLLVSSYLKHLTDLSVLHHSDVSVAKELGPQQWTDAIREHQILVLTGDVCLYLVTQGYLLLGRINLLVVDDCRSALKQSSLNQLLRNLNLAERVEAAGSRILAFTSVTLNQHCDPARLKAEFEYLEKILHGFIDTSSDIVTVLRYCSKPQERIVVCANVVACSLSEKLEECMLAVRKFLDDHRYDPFEIYEEEFLDELQGVPDPKVEPLDMLEEFLFILRTLGPWCADRAAFALLIKIENLKVKTPYERHYLLLSMLSTVLIKVRAICDDEFQKYTDNECVLTHCTPRVLRLIEILKTFKPTTPVVDKETSNNPTKTDSLPSDTLNNINATKPTGPMKHFQGRNWKARNAKGHRRDGPLKMRFNNTTDQELLCAIIFVEKRFTAKILFYLISELCRSTDDLSYLSVQYTVEKISDPILGGKEAENEHRKQEEVLKKFRMHECNLLVATSVLEEGIDIPKCNLVVRFDQPPTYNSYVQSKGRAKMPKAHFILMTEETRLAQLVNQMARYKEIEKMLLTKCKNKEPAETEEQEADLYSNCVEPYVTGEGATVSMTTAIALVNKYCAKLPSDTFTRLTALWTMQPEPVARRDSTDLQTDTSMYSCAIRLPINSPLKRTVRGIAMPSGVLAKRVAALQVCKILHEMGELDDNLMPVGKETFRAFEEDWNSFPMEECDELLTRNNMEPRPGTTKRRQYYYKRIADSLTNCRPIALQPAYLYLINMTLSCPLPEEQNTRGRRIYPPEESPQGFGILTLKQVPTICPFPIFTRSGEVQVSLELTSLPVMLTNEQLHRINVFLNYVFTNVLRLQKYLMLFDPNSSENSYFIVPTNRTVESGATTVQVDWKFLDIIFENRDLTPKVIPEENRKNFQFDSEKYQDAVVMPWYRNQDQPQYFYVAEVCMHLNPQSSFPGTDYRTFEEYYFKKYGLQIQNIQQPLLDVDHTSARLNFLTPRYVNRKGVALPTSSEETKRAKRENLEQKQILVPELCTVHPFPASLWRKAVCLPCILYRLNALLLADQIRKQVAEELALGQVKLASDFRWNPLNFGWSLSDVLKKSRDNKATTEEKDVTPAVANVATIKLETTAEQRSDSDNGNSWMEIGTWSNEMAQSPTGHNHQGTDSPFSSHSPDNMIVKWNPENADTKPDAVRYGSPTSWIQNSCNDYYDYDSDDSCDSFSSEAENSESSNKSCGIRIEFKGDNIAEAIDLDSEKRVERLKLMAPPEQDQKTDSEQGSPLDDEMEAAIEEHGIAYLSAVERNTTDIMSSGVIVPVGEKFQPIKCHDEKNPLKEHYKTIIQSSLSVSNTTVTLRDSLAVGRESVQDALVHSISCDISDECKTDRFSFDFQPDLDNHSGPSPSVILQALTMSNANDGINLERLETIGDSFLKYAITNYLYSTYENIHEGKLSHLRSKQVSNLNLYRLGRAKVLGESMIATKFDPHDNWLPPCYYVPRELEQALIDAKVPDSYWGQGDIEAAKIFSRDKICQIIQDNSEKPTTDGEVTDESKEPLQVTLESVPCLIPYNLITQHSIPDKSIADCVEALIGAYLIECGPRGALLFMAWLGIRVLPKSTVSLSEPAQRPVGSLRPEFHAETDSYSQVRFGHLTCPRSPLLHYCDNAQGILDDLLDGYLHFEESIGYHFRDRSYLLQAMTHASYSPNTVTDCYQRLEFLGDAVLDFLITRHLYNDPRLHSPGALTDLRSALVNNTIFASLAVRHGFHKYFRHLSPGLHEVVNRFVQIQEENGHSISEEYYLIAEDESEEIEDVEVPKALGDVFESVAGAIFCDSGMSLDAVWLVYYRMMHNEIEQFSTSVPKSPIRELLELEPETAKFGKPEKLADGRRVRVTVEVFGKGTFKGIGRNYRIAKCTAAKCALKQLKKKGMIVRKN